METLADYLDRVMRQKQLRPKDVAARSGLKVPHIIRLRNGKQVNPTVETMKKLAMGLDVNGHEIFAAASGIEANSGTDALPLLDLLQKFFSDGGSVEDLRQRLERQ
jgi:transcriptional regulator with XRE-family HTH domain